MWKLRSLWDVCLCVYENVGVFKQGMETTQEEVLYMYTFLFMNASDLFVCSSTYQRALCATADGHSYARLALA